MSKLAIRLVSLMTLLFIVIVLISLMIGEGLNSHVISINYHNFEIKAVSNLLIDVDRRFEIKTLELNNHDVYGLATF